jgi:hypothetical protein
LGEEAMKVSKTRWLVSALATALISMQATGQELQVHLKEMMSSGKPAETYLQSGKQFEMLIPFADEWNSVAAKTFQQATKFDDYSAFKNVDSATVGKRMMAVGNASEGYFSGSSADEQLDMILKTAVEVNSPIKWMNKNDVFEAWLTSKAIVDDAASDKGSWASGSDPRLQYCIWILGGCPRPPTPSNSPTKKP